MKRMRFIRSRPSAVVRFGFIFVGGDPATCTPRGETRFPHTRTVHFSLGIGAQNYYYWFRSICVCSKWEFKCWNANNQRCRAKRNGQHKRKRSSVLALSDERSIITSEAELDAVLMTVLDKDPVNSDFTSRTARTVLRLERVYSRKDGKKRTKTIRNKHPSRCPSRCVTNVLALFRWHLIPWFLPFAQYKRACRRPWVKCDREFVWKTFSALRWVSNFSIQGRGSGFRRSDFER